MKWVTSTDRVWDSMRENGTIEPQQVEIAQAAKDISISQNPRFEKNRITQNAYPVSPSLPFATTHQATGS